MTEYQLMLLRFLRMKQEFPHLKHDGHEPMPYAENVSNGVPDDAPTERLLHRVQRRRAELEFYRPMERTQ